MSTFTKSYWQAAKQKYDSWKVDMGWQADTIKSFQKELQTPGSSLWNYIQQQGYTPDPGNPAGWTMAGDKGIPGPQLGALQNWYFMQKAAEQSATTAQDTMRDYGASSGGSSVDDQLKQQKDAELQALNEQNKLFQQLIDRLTQFNHDLDVYNKSLMQGDLSILSPEEKYKQARIDFEQNNRLALTGDEFAQQQWTTLSSAFLEASRAYNASNDGYVTDFRMIQQYLATLTEQNEAAKQIAAAQLRVTDTKLTEQNNLVALQTQVMSSAQSDSILAMVADAA